MHASHRVHSKPYDHRLHKGPKLTIISLFETRIFIFPLFIFTSLQTRVKTLNHFFHSTGGFVNICAVVFTNGKFFTSGGNCLIAYLYVLVSPRLCRIRAKKACLSFLIVQLQHPSSTPLISSACNACSFLVYIYVLHTNLTAYATFYHSEHCLWIN